MWNWLHTNVFRVEVGFVVFILAMVCIVLFEPKLPRRAVPVQYEEQMQCRGGYAFIRKTDGATYPITGRNGVATPCTN